MKDSLHPIQIELIKKLSTTPSLRFNELLIEDIESEHINYHIQKLKVSGFIEKQDDKYQLTDQGKDFSNLLDDDIKHIEKQPKTSVLLNIKRIDPKTGNVEQLVCRRLRQPYYCKVGLLTGKVRFGETLAQAAARELFEETGLTATTMIIEQIHHKLRHRPDGEFVQDVIFYKFFITDLEGHFIPKTSYQENIWLSYEDYKNRTDLDYFENFTFDNQIEPTTLTITENVAEADGF